MTCVCVCVCVCVMLKINFSSKFFRRWDYTWDCCVSSHIPIKKSVPQSDYCSVFKLTRVTLCLEESGTGTRKHVLCRKIIQFSKRSGPNLTEYLHVYLWDWGKPLESLVNNPCGGRVLKPGLRARSTRAAQRLSDCKKRRLAKKGLCVTETVPACQLRAARCAVRLKY